MAAVRQDASTGELVHGEGTTPKTPPENLVHVKVWSPFRVYYDDVAMSVSGVNGTGPFDILPRHHNFITLLSPGELKLQTKDGETKIKISGGIMHVRKDSVIVFLEV
jgi:F0F1-type ATP synthase epsilon subunit